MIQFIHEPTLLKVEWEFSAAIAGAIGLWAQAVRTARRRNRDINRPEVFRREMYAEDDLEEIIVENAPSIPVNHETPRLWSRRDSIVDVIYCVMLLAGGWLGIRSYAVLRCWDSAASSMSSKDYTGAEMQCRRALRLDPAAAKSHVTLSQALTAEGKREQAVPELHAAACEEPDDADIQKSYGDCLMSVGRPAEAELVYRKVIVISPKLADGYVKLGACLARLHRADDAVRELRYAVQLDPKNVQAHITLGGALVAQGDAAAGLFHLKRAVELSPDDVITHNALATGYASSGMYGEAVGEFQAAIAIDPEFAIAYFNLGAALEDLHNTRGAMDAYAAYLRRCGDHPGSMMVGVPSAFAEIARLRSVLYSRPRPLPPDNPIHTK